MTNGHDDLARLRRENDALANAIAALEARIPSAEELAWLREQRSVHLHTAWAWAQIKRHAPWVATTASVLAGVITYLATHTVSIGPKP